MCMCQANNPFGLCKTSAIGGIKQTQTDLLYLFEDVPDSYHTADSQAYQILSVKLIVDDLCWR